MSIGNMFIHEGNILTNKNKRLSNKKIYVSNKNILKIFALNALNAWNGKTYLKDSLTIMKSLESNMKCNTMCFIFYFIFFQKFMY